MDKQDMHTQTTKGFANEQLTMLSDDALLDQFFAEARQPVADNGFTERVVASLPAHTVCSLRCLSTALNIFTVVAGVALLIYLGFFTRIADFYEMMIARIISGIQHFDADAMLVQTILFIHRVPDMLPSATQIIAIGATMIILTTLALQRFVKQI
ncbi:MAG: DUF5056 domain-containing protein [Bacteroidales bacterium]|nr:DUF5056 domain-containing protein [Bacteroidales bacterium]